MERKLNAKEQVLKLTSMAVLAGISVVVVLFSFPIIPGYAFLEYDAADVFILLAGLLFGWAAGVEVLIVAAAVQALTVSAGSGWMGFIMHMAATSALVLTACLTHDKLLRKPPQLPLCLALGCIAMIAVMIPANLIIMPLFTGAPREMVVKALIPAIIPFNAIKAGANSVLAGILYFAILPILRKTPINAILKAEVKQY